MKTNLLTQGAMTENSTGVGTVTRATVRERAVELAVLNGHTAHDVSKSDWEQAKRELTGEPDMAPKEAVVEFAPESERGDSVSGSTGHQVLESPSEGEDDEGRNESAQLVEEGVEEAERDQMIQAARTQRREDEV